MSDIIGLTPQAISQYERGLRTPDETIIYKLVDALDIAPADLLGDNDSYDHQETDFVKLKFDAYLNLFEYLGYECESYSVDYKVTEKGDTWGGFSITLKMDNELFQLRASAIDELESMIIDKINSYNQDPFAGIPESDLPF